MSKYYTNPVTIVLQTESGKPTILKPNPESDNPNWYFVHIPNKGDIVEIGKEYYEVLYVIHQAIRNRNMYDNPRHKPSTLIVKFMGRFDKVNLFASSH